MSNKMERREPSFSIFEFKYWLSKQPDADFDVSATPKKEEQDKSILNKVVESRLGETRLELQIAEHNQSLTEQQVASLSKEFKKDGGTVIALEGLNVTIQTQKGDFSLPQLYTKLKN